MVTFTLTNRQAERIRLLLWNMDDVRIRSLR
jgi:hypothetical protein